MAIVIPATFRFGIPDPMPIPPPGWAVVARNDDWLLYMHVETGKFYIPEFKPNGDLVLYRWREATPEEQGGFKETPRYIFDKSESITLAQGAPGGAMRDHFPDYLLN